MMSSSTMAGIVDGDASILFIRKFRSCREGLRCDQIYRRSRVDFCGVKKPPAVKVGGSAL